MKQITVKNKPSTMSDITVGNNIPTTVVKVLTPALTKAGESLGYKISKGIDNLVDYIFNNK